VTDDLALPARLPESSLKFIEHAIDHGADGLGRLA
jgi:hypothetical protein